MRCFKLFSVVVLLAAFQLTMAQTQTEPQPIADAEVDLSRSVHLYPNPATDFIDVKLDQFLAKDIDLTIHSIIGNELPVDAEIRDEHWIRVNLKELAAGYYLLAVRDEDSKFRGTYKFLKR